MADKTLDQFSIEHDLRTRANERAKVLAEVREWLVEHTKDLMELNVYHVVDAVELQAKLAEMGGKHASK